MSDRKPDTTAAEIETPYRIEVDAEPITMTECAKMADDQKTTTSYTAVLAGQIAEAVFPRLMDTSKRDELRTLLIVFAEEIKRSAIEP